jgi:hypothetical protein
MQYFSAIYTIPSQIFSDSRGEYINEYVDEINKSPKVNKYIGKIYPNIKRGDVVYFEDWGDYRNTGKLMWNGTKLIILASDYDDYGHVPYEIKIEEFPHRDYFSKSIDHNSLINIMGSDYKIIEIETDVETEKQYWYTISHKEMTLKWTIESSDKPKKFKKNLKKGVFSTGIMMGSEQKDILFDC